MFSDNYARSLMAACGELPGLEALKGAKVLITGATGLIGSCLVDALLLLNAARGMAIEIHAAGRSEPGMRARFGASADDPRFHYVPYDATKPLALDFEADYVVHAATSAHPLAYATDPVGILQANVVGTMNLLEALRGWGHGRFLLLSTGEIYGENPTLPEGFSEADTGAIDTMKPRACYPEGKRAAETLCASYAAQYGVNARVARLCHVYGPTFTPSNSRADAQFLRNALNGQDIVMKSAGSQVRSWCYVADAVSALMTLLVRGEAGQAYNVANRHAVASIRQYAQTLADIAGVKLVFELPPELEKAGYTKISRAVLNPTKLEGLGWKPRYGLREGLEESYRACKY
ncbi:MAG: NAD-dependent epimerase/dehydratase family protein [Clostridia bacterium]|nr:NAD-dependent epimerase/dehydratase family protein [Clostridia bacterium]